jgi:hypothetical protein
MSDSTDSTGDGLQGEQSNVCQGCGQSLCLRKTVINLALGNGEKMFCLICLAEQNDSTPTEVLEGIRDYILGRECFRKEWVKYPNRGACPDPDGCIPDVCFGGDNG